MKKDKMPKIAVLCGGRSSERDVSLVSGRAVYAALKDDCDTAFYALDDEALPADINPRDTVVFPVFHGKWGEDGGVQRLLDEHGFEYAGCGAEASARCMDKARTKTYARLSGIPVVDEIVFDAANPPKPADVAAHWGDASVLKPVDEGSSFGLHMTDTPEALARALSEVKTGRWMLEPRIRGREFAVGVLESRALGIVEIKPQGGVYDTAHKYTAGSTVYEFPAKLPDKIAARMHLGAEAAFKACLCRDFARVDFMMDGESGPFYLLEINTIPGLTPTSLMPKSALCEGMDFKTLARAMLAGAVSRWRERMRADV